MNKISKVADFVCRRCPQYWDGDCRAFNVPHSNDERRAREERVMYCDIVLAGNVRSGNKEYYGRRLGPENELPDVIVTVDGNPLPHVVHHSPTGYEWGYCGSGPADLARSILANYFGKTQLWFVDNFYQLFKEAFVARFGDEWFIRGCDIDQWFRES
jgi:hypothetical protein